MTDVLEGHVTLKRLATDTPHVAAGKEPLHNVVAVLEGNAEAFRVFVMINVHDGRFYCKPFKKNVLRQWFGWTMILNCFGDY